MIAALRSGQLRHAALDVFATEPLPPGHELTRLENVTLSAHSAFRTPEASETLIRRALDIARGLEAPWSCPTAPAWRNGRRKLSWRFGAGKF